MSREEITLAVRLDKWLWAARFFKTRALAQEAIERGRVKVNDAVAKPSRDIRGGEMLHIVVGELTWEVEVLGVNDQRRPASEARLLYRETPEGAARRMTQIEQRRLAPEPSFELQGRPTKKDRRLLQRWRGE
ncbi:MAG TPA: RNA-binding S4 domain-containing protein [Burkholderiaceae bacterium]|nr:RNA-binding S4 domain-containing protein [Burkholderiaceae bacterium]